MPICQNLQCGKEFTPKPKAYTAKYCSQSCKHYVWRLSHAYSKSSAKLQSEKKGLQLGMSFGKANSILHKMVFFKLVQRLSLAVCFRCGHRIDTPRELSLDHVEDWLDVDPALFWDVDNIKFSHLSCNIAAGSSRHTGDKLTALAEGRSRLPQFAVNAPEGTAWCSRHKLYLPKINFNKSKRSLTGTQPYCKECHLTFTKGTQC